MSTTVTYKGSTLATVNNNTKTLKTAGKYMEGDVVLTDVSGGTAAISVVDTTDSHGGTIREITALDISDTTAVASDVANGKYFYTSAGVKTAGTASGGSGGSGAQVSTTGTFTGNGTNSIQISCAFEPREIYIRGDLTGDVSLRGVVSFTLIKDKILVSTNDSSTSNTKENAWYLEEINGYNEDNSSTAPYVTYSNGTLTIDTVMNSSGAKWPSGITYNYTLVGFASPTEHIIHLEFEDITDVDIPVYYDNSLLGTMITAYTPETYGQKTVDVAELDGVAWYTRPTEIWETVWNDDTGFFADTDPNAYPYCWITALADVSIPTSSVWRVTFDNTVYRLIGYPVPADNSHGAIGNALYLSNGTDDGSDVPFAFYHTAWGAWSGSADVVADTGHSVKIERLVTA